ncbi:MAG: prepilin-type N-terminal cleavage/methylation domain-containing protein [Gemmatimonadota bacterium]
MLKQGKRGGFTLPEVLVTVAIIAVLAAAVVPAVTQQLGKADAPAFDASMGSLRTAISSFVSDVRRFPGKIDDLQTAPTASTDFDLSGNGLGAGAGTLSPLGTAFTSSVVARWRGPYENSSNATGQVGVGYGWTTVNAFRDSLGFLVVDLTKSGADSTDAHELEAAIDGSSAGSNLTGLVRYKIGVGAALLPANTVYIHLMSSAR